MTSNLGSPATKPSENRFQRLSSESLSLVEMVI